MVLLRNIGLFLLLLLLFGAALGTFPVLSASDAPQKEAKKVVDFRDIPDVTQEEVAAIETLREKHPTLVYGMMHRTKTFLRPDGSVGGHSALFCAWLSDLFGIVFTPRIYSWEDLISEFEGGKIAFTTELDISSERRKKYFMTGMIAERALKAFRVKGSEPLSALAQQRRLRYAFLKGALAVKAVTDSSEFATDAILAATVKEAVAMLHAGLADAFISDEQSAILFGDDIVAEDIFPVVHFPAAFSTAVAEYAPIVSALDKYLRNGAMPLLQDMDDKGRKEYLRHKFFSRLTGEEKSYLETLAKERKSVPVAADDDLYPASFWNKREGAWQGIAIDVLRKISEASGLEFTIVNRTGVAWPEVLATLEKGEAAMITELISTKERQGRFLWAEEPYALDYYVLLSRADHADVSLDQALHSTVGLLAGSGYAEIFRHWFPGHKFTREYAYLSNAFEAMEKGEIDLLMASRNILLNATHYHENPRYKANIIFDRTFGSSFAFHKNQKTLRSIVSKAQELVDADTIAERWMRKTFDYQAKMARAKIPYLVGIITLLLSLLGMLLVLFFRNREMNKQLEATVKERTAELEVQTEAARVASRAKGDFLSHISHEIRTPLNAIIGMSRVAKQSAMIDGQKTLTCVNSITSASQHLLGILNGVLDMAKIEAGKLSLANEPFFLIKSVQEVEDIIAQRCSEKNIIFTADFSDVSVDYIVGDSLRLKQVLINLLGNAAKFTEQGGNVSLRVVELEKNRDSVVFDFSVCDSGIGMTEEQLSRIFTAFDQADATTATRFGGTGLGLAISRDIVGKMGGDITVTSDLGRGSKFSFTLRFATADEVPAEKQAASEWEKYDFSGKHVLLAEDIEVNRIILMELLGDSGMVFDTAEDGEKAVSLFADSPPGYYDLIFMDIQMPLLDGYEATRRIRAINREDARTVPIIAMTASAYREDIEKALQAGMNGHLGKPIELEKVKRLLDGLLTKKFAARAVKT